MTGDGFVVPDPVRIAGVFVTPDRWEVTTIDGQWLGVVGVQGDGRFLSTGGAAARHLTMTDAVTDMLRSVGYEVPEATADA